MPRGTFIGLDTADLNELKTEFTACLKAIAVAGQSYTIAGRSFTKANLKEVGDTLGEINHALKLKSGTRSRVAYDNFNPPFRK
ncbi:MAG: hypothetical protein AAF571_10355 [Verrucomicrobiota bacterium]